MVILESYSTSIEIGFDFENAKNDLEKLDFHDQILTLI